MTFSASPLTPDQGAPAVTDDAWRRAAQRVLTAVTEAMPQIPSADPLMPDAPGRETTAASLPDPAGAAVTAYLGGGVEGKVLLVVGQELVTALQGTPFGDVEPAQAMAPALETLATALGGRLEGSPTSIAVADCLDVLSGGTTVLVPLLAGDVVQALVAVSIVDRATPDAGRGPGAGNAGGPAGGGAGDGGKAARAAATWGIDMLRDVEMEVTCELGRTRMTVRQLLALAPGDVVELDRLAGSPADLLVNGTLLARGELVVVLLVAVLAARVARRAGRRGGRGAIAVRERVGLARDVSAVVLEVGDRLLLLGVSAQQVNVLAELGPAGTVVAGLGPVPARAVPVQAMPGPVIPVQRASVRVVTGAPSAPPLTRREIRAVSTRRRAAVPPTRRGTGSVLDPRTWQQGLEALRDLTARRQ